MTLLEVEGLTSGFQVKRRQRLFFRRAFLRSVNEVSFALAEGESLGVVGESGSGKSTLGRTIAGLHRGSNGDIRWQGGSIFAGVPAALRNDIQMIFQDPLGSLDPRMTVGASIAEGLRARQPDLPRKARREAVAAMLDRVGFPPDFATRFPHELSGGQAQRVAIARALVMKPRLVICDEPVSALDVSTQANILELIAELRRAEGISLIFITHDLSVARRVCDRVMVMYLGRLVEIGTRDAIFSTPRHPYTKALIAAVPEPDPALERAKARAPVSGELPSPLDPPSGCVFRTRCPLAQPLCADRAPQLRPLGAAHDVACHFA